MTYSVQSKTQKLNKEHKNRSVWQRIVTILAAVVVFITTYALILPAITWERQLICELDEHAHTESCYQEVTVPASKTVTCALDEHTHTGDCYTSELICGLAESEGHVHSESCYDAEGGIICGHEESAGHTHTDACWQKTLTCTKKEHTHTADCESFVPEHKENKLICGKEEHKHTESCFDAPPAYDDGYYCGIVAHKHSVKQGCYYDDGVTLKCTLAEHEHVLQCQSNPKADVEDAFDWESELAGIELSGNWSRDVLTIAKSQLGYKESAKNYRVTENDEIKGYTRYGAKYGDPYGDWCAMFCSFCLDYAGVTEFPINANCQAWIESLEKLEVENAQTVDENKDAFKYYEEAAIAQPNPGDLVFFDENADNTADHIAIVTGITEATEEKPAKLLTIEGNWDDVVCEVERNLDDTTILGYGILPINPNAPEFGCVLEFDGEDYKVEVNYSKESNIPDGATLDVREIEQGSDEYNSYYDKLVEDKMSDKVTFCRLFDISILVDGAEFEPEVPVKVNIIYKDGVGVTVEGVCAETYHFTNEGEVECLATDIKTDEEGNDVFEYVQSSFSVVANMLASSTPQTATFYQVVDKIDSTTADYIIVSAEGSFALVAGANNAQNVTGTHLDLIPVKGNPGYYEIEGVTNNMLWRFNTTITGTSGNAQIRNGTNGVYLYQTRSGGYFNSTYPLMSTTAGNESLTYNAKGGYWRIKGTANNVTTRYIMQNTNGNGQFTSGSPNTSTSTASNTNNTESFTDMIILKRMPNTTLEIPDDPQGQSGHGGGSGQGETPIRPDYPQDETTTISGSKTGEADITSIIPGANSGISVTYKSDPSTSKIEDQFPSVKTESFNPAYNDGKVAIDKSVVYGKDDYGAFSEYEDGTFGVALSVMGQSYKLKYEDMVKIPVDVVFVLDVSGSMEAHNAGNVTRTQAVVNAVNSAMDIIMNDNPENRAGIVMYSSGGASLLSIDHYTAGTGGQYLEYSGGDIYTRQGLRGDKYGTITRTSGQETNGFQQGNGTYTQYGIALGYNEFEKITDTTYTTTLYAGTGLEKEVTVKRQPVIILLSDGDPTHCTSNYADVLNGPHYGDGVYSGADNNRGVQGYYTILSANYYKKMVGVHYDNAATFYTIGMGINETGYADMSNNSATGDDYKRFVLDPSILNSGNVNTYLNRNSKNYSTVGTWLYQLLTNSFTANNGNFAEVGHYTPTHWDTTLGTIGRFVPVLDNPYSDYAYADEARFGNLNENDLTEYFSHIIESNLRVNNYGFMLYSGSTATVSDSIGKGMEIKGNPVLHYNGVNYPTVKSGPYTEAYSGLKYYEYTCDRTVYTTDNSGTNGKQREFDLRRIEIKETINIDGTTTISMYVPEEILPNLMPSDTFSEIDDTAEWYYEMLPARLIYQVGLNDEAKAEISNLKAGETKTFQTNYYGPLGTGGTAYQEPHENNPYYYPVDYEDGTHSDPKVPYDNTVSINKTENTTGTAGTSLESEELDNGWTGPDGVRHPLLSIYSYLGNNGTLTFEGPVPEYVNIELVKVDMAGDPITSTPATFAVYTNADLANNHLFGTYTTDNVNGSLTITDLTPDTTYYLKETRAPDGHSLMTEVKTFSVAADGTVTGIDPSDTYLYVDDGKLMVRNPTGYVLPATGGNGAYIVCTIGVLLIAGALLTSYVLRHRREKDE